MSEIRTLVLQFVDVTVIKLDGISGPCRHKIPK